MDKYCDNNDNKNNVYGKSKNIQQKNNNNLILENNIIMEKTDDEKKMKDGNLHENNLDYCWKNKKINILTETTNNHCKQNSNNILYQKNNGEIKNTEQLKLLTENSRCIDEKQNDENEDEKYSIKSECEEDDSTDNLSYLNENDIIDDIILLPDNVLSDDEISNPEDCVYAYRGIPGSPELPQQLQQQQQDDETDFLEMDFDPEPTSETDVYLSGTDFNRIGIDDIPKLENNFVQTLDVVVVPSNNITPILSIPEFEEKKLNIVNEKLLTNEINLINNSDEIKLENIDLIEKIPDIKTKVTGTKPKKPQQQQSQQDCSNKFTNQNLNKLQQQILPSYSLSCCTSSLTSLQLQTSDHHIDSSHEYNNKKLQIKNNHINNNNNNNNHHHNSNNNNNNKQLIINNTQKICLDCTENEFLFNTNRAIKLNETCYSCNKNNKENYQRITNKQIRADKIQNLGLNLTEYHNNDYNPKKYTKLQLNLPIFNNTKFTVPDLAGFNEKISMENTVNIFSLNCDEKILIDALNIIGIEPDKLIIHNYFEENKRDTSEMNIPDYLNHISKSNCDYNKLIKLIQTSCTNYNLNIHFCPEDPFSCTPETINVLTIEIIKRWNTNTNLKEMLKIRNKHFHTMNILGKIINILRQSTQRREMNAESFIKIPQYYKSGFIRVTKNFKQ